LKAEIDAFLLSGVPLGQYERGLLQRVQKELGVLIEKGEVFLELADYATQLRYNPLAEA
jgi:hypothetical protein